MPNSKEDLTKTGVSIEELRSKIVRAANWRELFPSREQEMADFVENLVGAAKAEYKSNGSLRQHRVEQLPEGDLHVFERTTNGLSSTYQKLESSGNVVITFNHPDGSSNSDIVTPDVGNVAHEFTAANTVLPDREFLEQLGDEKLQAVAGTHLMALTFYIKGKPATKGWEETMLYNGHLPQRIGHRVFPNFVLEAQSRLQQAYPQVF